VAATVVKTTRTTAGATTRCTTRTVRVGNKVTVTRRCVTQNARKGEKAKK
jgi:hypothetical protein